MLRVRFYTVNEGEREVHKAATLFDAASVWNERSDAREVWVWDAVPGSITKAPVRLKKLSVPFLRELLRRRITSVRPEH
jgi:hypothetical protein